MSQSRFPVTRGASRSPSTSESWNDWFNRFMFPSFFERSLSTGAVAPVDVCERENEFVVHMGCAGCRPEDVDVTVENDTVRIRGKYPEHEMAMGTTGQAGTRQGPAQGTPQGSQQGNMPQGAQTSGAQPGMHETCIIRELPTGRFERDITLPVAVNAQQAHASFENGLLTLTLPKAQAAMGHRVQITRGSEQGAGTGSR
jgi:HSP20 family protein